MPTIKQNLGRVRIDNKGAWKPGTYDNLDVVTLGGSSYMCVQDGTTTEPTTLQGWEVLATKGDTGEKGDRGEKGEKGEKGDRGEKGDTGLQGTQGIQGVKGDPFTYADFTESQIAELQRPATDAAAVADKANKDAQAAIAEVKATEAKLYPAAENILKDTVKDTFVHVNDAFAGGALREITIEGACKQDGTPSPENPVPIQVVEHPVVKVVGRNLLDIAALANDRPVYYKIDGDTLTILKSDNGAWSGIATTQELKAGTYILSGDNIEIRNTDNNMLSTTNNAVGSPFTLAADTEIKMKIGYGMESKYPYTTKAMIERSSSISDYAPYASQSQSFTLPAEHPYLAKLPNGTSDEIVVDRDGNVELVARVGVDKDVRKLGGDFAQGKYYSLETGLKPFESAHADYTAPVMCSAIKSMHYATDEQGIYRTWNGVYVKDTSGRTKEEIQAEVDKNAPLTVVAKIPETRYPLGKIELPKAQDSVVNVWTDAEVTPRTGIEYVRDVNIVVGNLETAIASIIEG